MLDDFTAPVSPNRNLPEAVSLCKRRNKKSIWYKESPPLILSKGRIKIRKGRLNKNFPKKTKIAAAATGIIIINDLNLSAIFFGEARTKDLSDQITINASIANIKNLI